MDEYSPWGSDDAPPARRAPSPPLPSFSSSAASVPATSDQWGDDGGWGGATDDFSTGFGSHSQEVEVTEEDVDLDEPPVLASSSSAASSFGGGWGRVDSPELPPIARAEAFAHEEELASSSPALDASSPRREPEDFAPASPPNLPSFSPPPSSPSLFPSEPPEPTEEPTRKDADDDDWGGHGAEVELPPIVGIAKVESAQGWGGGEDEWQPAAVPEPMPSFGHSFGGSPAAAEVEDVEEEGWGGAKEDSWGPGLEDAEVPSREPVQEPDGDGEWAAAPSLGSRRGKSIPASLVDGLKVDSRKLAESSWTVSPDAWGTGGFQEQSPAVTSMLSSLLEPPTLPQPSPSSTTPAITPRTPLTSLFRLTPELYPAFRDGLDKTAVRTAETLKGTASNAYRNARFGRGAAPGAPRPTPSGLLDGESSLSRPDLPSERGHMGDEFDIDGPGGLASVPEKKSWWGGGSTEPASPTTNMPRGLLTRKEDPVPASIAPVSPTARTASPAGDAPSKLGRFFGRFRNSADDSHSRSSSRDESAEWKGDVSQLEGPVGAVAQAKYDDRDMDDELGSIFGDAPKSQRVPPTDSYEFGGLLGGLAVTPAVRKSTTSSLDPFDPFGDDDDDVGGSMAALAPTPTARVLSPLAPTPTFIRPSSPLANPPIATAASFAAIAAPQARTAPSVVATDNSADSFDAFFSSFSPPASGSTPLSAIVTSPTSSISPSSFQRLASPPPRTSTLSPPSRTATISPPSIVLPRSIPTIVAPPARSGPSPAGGGAFAPPPPPLQPVNRGGFNIAPPPPSISPVVSNLRSSTPTAPSPVAPPVAVRPPPPKSAGSGPLSFDDLSFFEG